MENKQTAITWLINELIQNRLMTLRYDADNTFGEIIEKAKQMEKEQIIQFANDYLDDDADLTAEQYYNETFKK
jgi:hypothetical protein